MRIFVFVSFWQMLFFWGIYTRSPRLYTMNGVRREQDATGWRRCIGCLKLRVAFHQRATTYRAHLRKMIYKDNASYIFATLYSLAFTSFNATFLSLLNRYILFLGICPRSPRLHTMNGVRREQDATGWLRLAGCYGVATVSRSLLQNTVSFTGLFCKRYLQFYRSY